jgi:hypothetical protein
MAECVACWYLSGHLGYQVSVGGRGRRGGAHDLQVLLPDGPANVEVKAPHRPLPDDGFWYGDDSDILSSSLRSANRQFHSANRNLLVLVPTLKTPVFSARRQLTKAFFAELGFSFPVNLETGVAEGHGRTTVIQRGNFLRRIKSDGSPGFTRVSAVLRIEERCLNNDILALVHARSPHELPPAWIDHAALLLHNPNAVERRRISLALALEKSAV